MEEKDYSISGLYYRYGKTTDNEAIFGLKEFLKVTYLVKSSSRFFVKQDIGEVLDQLGWEYMLDEKIKAICLNDEYESLPDTGGEHFLMTVTLLIEE